MPNNKPVIAVIAHRGMVGGTLFNYFEKKGHEVMGWSRSNRTHEWEEINKKADYIFICVPTPFDWDQNKVDLTALSDTLYKIEPREDRVVVIKSTVPPETTEKMQKRFSMLNILFNPEFLSESTAEADFSNPDRQLIGYTEKSYKYAVDTLHLLPQSAYDVIMKATEAEIVKYVNNVHGATMVIFANFFKDLADHCKVDFERIRIASIASKWVGSAMGRQYWDVNHGGFRGYGGKCFPKDVNTLLAYAKDNRLPYSLLQVIKDMNVSILAQQGLTEKDAEKKGNRV